MLPGIGQHRLHLIGRRQGGSLRPQLAGQLQGLQDATPLGLRQPVQARGFHIDRMPGAAQPGCQPRRGAHHLVTAILGAQTEQQGVLGMPDAVDVGVAAVLAHLTIHPLGGAAQRQLPQRHQVALAEEVFDGPLRLTGQVDLALLQTLTQIVRGQIDQHHLVGTIKHPIRHCLAHPDAGDAADDVVETLQVLDVDGGEDVDPRLQQLLHILPALGVTGAGHIGVGQLVHQHHRRVTGQHAVQVKLGQTMTAIEVVGEQLHFESGQQRRRLAAAMGLHQSHQHIQPLGPQPLGLLQHGVGLAHPRTGAEEDLQLASLSRLGQQRIRIRAARFIHTHGYFLAGRDAPAASSSSARFNANTFTTGAPNTPRGGISICRLTSASTWAKGSWRAAATRATW